jgi:hypothetical protein
MMTVERSVEWELAEETEYSENTCPSATLSTTNPTSPDLGSNPSRRGGKPATNRLSYGATCSVHLVNYHSLEGDVTFDNSKYFVWDVEET